MSDKGKKTFRIICLTGNREIVAESKEDAWRKAIVKGWKPLFRKRVKDNGKEKTHL